MKEESRSILPKRFKAEIDINEYIYGTKPCSFYSLGEILESKEIRLALGWPPIEYKRITKSLYFHKTEDEDFITAEVLTLDGRRLFEHKIPKKKLKQRKSYIG